MRTLNGIEVKLVLSGESRAGLRDFLISLQTFWRGEPYYATVIGLTDSEGRIRMTGQQFRRDFENDRRTFPADYKVSLPSCDDVVEFVLRGGNDFARHRQQVLSNPLVDPDVRTMYRRARNEAVVSAAVRTQVGDDTGVASALVESKPL